MNFLKFWAKQNFPCWALAISMYDTFLFDIVFKKKKKDIFKICGSKSFLDIYVVESYFIKGKK